MNSKKALVKLELEEGATASEIKQQYNEFYNEFQLRITNAPTEHQRKIYQKKLEELEEAYNVLTSGGSSSQDELPGIGESVTVEKEDKPDESKEEENKTSQSLSEEEALTLLNLKKPFTLQELSNANKLKKEGVQKMAESTDSAFIREACQLEIKKLETATKILSMIAASDVSLDINVDSSNQITNGTKATSKSETKDKRLLKNSKSQNSQTKKTISKRRIWFIVLGIILSLLLYQNRFRLIHRIMSAEQIHSFAPARNIHGIYNAQEIYGVYSAAEIHSVYTAAEIHGVYKAVDIHGIYSVEEIHGVYTAEEIHGVYTAEEIHGIYTAEEIHEVYELSDILGVYSIEELKAVYSVKEIAKYYSLKEMVELGYTIKDLYQEFSRKEMSSYFDLKELIKFYGVGVGDFFEGGIIFEIDSLGQHGKVITQNDLGRYNLDGAYNRCNNLVLNGYSDWRLPTLNEFEQINKVKTSKWGLGKVSQSGSKAYWTSSCADWFDTNNCEWPYIFSFGWNPPKGLWGTGLQSDKIEHVRAVRSF